MAEIARWGNFVFEVSPETILSFGELSIKAARETETVNSGGQQYVKTKTCKPEEISLSVQMHSGLGYDVQEKAEALCAAVRLGDQSADYFYIGARKLRPCRMSVIEVTISDVHIGTGGTWTSAKAELSLRQAGMLDGTQQTAAASGGEAGSYGGSKITVRTATPSETDEIDAVTGAAPSISAQGLVQKAISTVQALVAAAKSASKKK